MHQQMLYMVATLLIVYELSLTTTRATSSRYAMAVAVDATSSSSLKVTEMDVNSFTHINKPSMMNTGMVNRMPRHTVQGLKQMEQMKEQKQQIEDPSTSSLASSVNSKIKRSFSNGGGWGTANFNGLTGLMGSSQQHSFRTSYDATPPQQQSNHQYQQQYTEAKPIYEEQQENDYAGRGADGGAGVHSSASVANAAALHSAIYNLQTAGTHNAAVGSSSSSASNGGSDGFLPSWNFGKLSTSFIASQPASTPYASSSGSHSASSTTNNNDKISEGNFLHHYDSASAFNEYTPQHEYQPSYQQQQQQLPQHENFYNSVEHTQADTSSSYGDEHEHDSNNYPPSASAGHFSNYQQHDYEQQQQEKQPDVINYVPYPVVKKQHVPVREPVQIPISHAVIIPVSKPVPIQIPVTQNVQVPVEKELKIPVERVVPYPVEKHIPVPVEKRVPYPVVKYVPIKIPRPFPVKVPVFKTVLHKVKGWW
ncbi:hypothetical protein FF38_12623 [Lucilia cuprina]|uniref:Uncharacterized protein n=1 Tax=Lucilia cuprina TaxID=7375 RepID=A0A0L0BQH2_LUCCU|nr:hypothetical protein CVS40_0119 [Lucilia cuprina]KNC21459.1 hypothetical protein FF38_12623 [Lucilia cuprina]